MNLDCSKLPLGLLKVERIRKAHAILNEIQKHLPVVPGKEQRIADLTKDFYQILPHSFGMKRPPNIDHVLRVKEKIKMLESLNDIVVTEHALTSQMDELKKRDAGSVLLGQLYSTIKHLPKELGHPSLPLLDTVMKAV